VKFASEEFETPVKVAVKLSGVEKGDLFIKIYTINGELVEILANNEKILEGEEKTFLWKGGKKLSSGVYIVHVNVNGNSKIQKIFLVK
jgi:flagellar hook assembly protein FlgD